MEEDTLIDASLDDFAASSSASPEIDYEYESQSGSASEGTKLRRSSRLRSKLARRGSASSVTTVPNKQTSKRSPDRISKRSEKKKKKPRKTSRTRDLGEHLNDYLSADVAASSTQHQNNDSEDAMQYTLDPPSPDLSENGRLAASAQLENSIDQDINLSDVDMNDDDNDDDVIDLAFREASMHDPDADANMSMYLNTMLPVSIPSRLAWGLASGIGETDIPSGELSFVSEQADIEHPQESDPEDDMIDDMDMSGQYESDGSGNANEQLDEGVEMHVREAMNGEISAPRSPYSGSPSPEVEFGDAMGNQIDGRVTPDTSLRGRSPDLWTPPGYGYTTTFKKGYGYRMVEAQDAVERQLKQAPPSPMGVSLNFMTTSNNSSDDSGSNRLHSGSPHQTGVMLPPSTATATTMALDLSASGMMPQLSTHERNRLQHGQIAHHSSSRSPSVNRAYATNHHLTSASASHSSPISRNSREHRPNSGIDRITPPRDIRPRLAFTSPSRTSRNSSLNRGGFGMPTTPNSPGVRPTIRLGSTSPTRPTYRTLARDVSQSPTMRPGHANLMNKSPQGQTLRRQLSPAPPNPQSQTPNYARFASRNSPHSPLLPPTPIRWVDTKTSSRRSSKSDLPIQPGTITSDPSSRQAYIERQHALDALLEEAAGIPLPRSSQSPEPAGVSGDSTDDSEDWNLDVTMPPRSSPSPSCESERAYHTPPPQSEQEGGPMNNNEDFSRQGNGDMRHACEKPKRYASQETIQKLMKKYGPLKTPNDTPKKRKWNFRVPQTSVPSWLRVRFSAWSQLRITTVIAIILSILLIVIRITFAPPPARPIPDIEKLTDIAQALEPMISYSDHGESQVKYLQHTELAVWDLGESIRGTGMESAELIWKELNALSENLRALSAEMTRFYIMINGDIDSILGSMEFSARVLQSLNSHPSPQKSQLVAAIDGVHTFFGRLAVLDIVSSDLLEKHLSELGKGDRNDLFTRSWVLPMKSLAPQPTVFGTFMRSVFGITWEQRALRTLTQTFAELLGTLEEAITGELDQSQIIFAIFEDMEGQFLRLSGQINREDIQQEGNQGELLSGLWAKIMGPDQVRYRKFERNRNLLASLRNRAVSNKGLILGTRRELMALKINLEILRKRLVKPLLVPEAYKRLFDNNEKKNTKDIVERRTIDATDAAPFPEDDSNKIMSPFSFTEEDPNVMTLREPLPALIGRRIEKLEGTREKLSKLRDEQKRKKRQKLHERTVNYGSSYGGGY